MSQEPATGLARPLSRRAILGSAVFPLEIATRKDTSEMHVEIDGCTYGYDLDRAQAMSEFKRTVSEALRFHVRDVVLGDDQLKARIQEFRTLLRQTLRRFTLSKQEGFSLFYQDEQHQLQHSAGVWQLVRGPLQVRMGSGSVFVALR